MIEARKQLRCINGHLHLPALRVALDEHAAAQVSVPSATMTS
jgi:hypothetical protein